MHSQNPAKFLIFLSSPQYLHLNLNGFSKQLFK